MSNAKEGYKNVKNDQLAIKHPPRTTLEGMIWHGMYKVFCTMIYCTMYIFGFNIILCIVVLRCFCCL